MHLERVTITGADEGIDPDILLMLNEAYPFVEFGILLSRSHRSEPRFPGVDWLVRVQHLTRVSPLRLSLHVCGRLVRDVLWGETPIPAQDLDGCARVQLNLGATRSPQHTPERFQNAMLVNPAPDKELIFQVCGPESPGMRYFEAYCQDHGNAVPLFDASGGRGVLPVVWPAPFAMADDQRYTLHGYAGGLTPENLAQELPRIAAVVGDVPVWIDLESGVRTDNCFDLEKVLRVLTIVQPFVRAM